MAKGQYLAEFEIYVMSALSRLGDQAYGMTVRQEIEARSGRNVAIGAVYATLDRLDRKSTRLNSSHRLTSRMPSSA